MKFGILSTANIGVKHVIPGIKRTDHEVTAISSRNPSRARQVAEKCDIREVYESYESLLSDSDVDAVYNPLPNGLHAEWTKQAVNNGRHVLCEKPLTADTDEAHNLRSYVKGTDCLVMEGLMYAYHPRTERALELVSEYLSEISSVTARFSFHLNRTDDIRLDGDLAGGSLMDIGYYPVDLVRSMLGTPQSIYGTLVDARGCGTDTNMKAIFEYDSGATAQLSSSFESPLTQFYRVEAANGWIEVRDAFDTPKDVGATIRGEIDGNSLTETFDPVDHYEKEVLHFARCFDQGTTPRTDLTRATQNMELVDAIRRSDTRGEPIAVV
ncbi:glucose-fructose oxidoreductase [Haloferax gibbonsii ATCC 33959]|uniref:Glucose-fructose oxidoreductase n=1 Tax=Haloferax gibbonsii (strain ATCC 33959 / DSM 4427 / JCM 8863 / NBRC 102184 / NCIMB 2188 / Ma 2.38) TaxID=1227459 RepID=M0HUW7_HALGM|nr:Gfo/Idh/MocA family oxidoreductase [Haloferax gibbonsii]ELZ86914.1 glucose-fructose oxidoreductase [Haloferax gibbonsii ATCC 33959]